MLVSKLIRSAPVAGALALALLGAAGPPARATTMLTLDNPASVVYQETAHSPCIFGGSSCTQPAGFGFTLWNNSAGETGVSTSPLYTVSQLVTVANGNAFSLGIDVNVAAGNDTDSLGYFQAWDTTTNTLLFSYAPSTPTLLAVLNNGSGFSDDMLKGFDLTGLASTDNIQFTVNMVNPTDGVESFFVVGAETPTVPEPTPLVLLGTGLFALAFLVRHRRRSV